MTEVVLKAPRGAGRRLASQVAAAVVLGVLALFASPTFFYLVLVGILAVAAWELLGWTHANDPLGRGLGVLLTVGHSGTLWVFEDNVHVLIPAQALLPLNALVLTLLNRREWASFSRRATGIGFTPLWTGLLTYLGLVRRAGADQGATLAVFVLVVALGGNVGAYLSNALNENREADLLGPRRLVLDVTFAVVVAGGSGAAVQALLPLGIPVLHALLLGAVGGAFSRIGSVGQALFERSSSASASPEFCLLTQLSALLLAAPLVYGYLQARAWLAS